MKLALKYHRFKWAITYLILYKTFGVYAAFIGIAEKDANATIPDHSGFDQAATSTEGAHYALSDIRAVMVEAGHHVMVNRALRAMGSAAV